MNTRIIAMALAVGLAASLAAEPPVRRTIIVRDGKVVSDDSTPADLPLLGKRPYLGVILTDVTPELRDYFGAPKDSGVLVGSVEDDSPAAKAGVRVGDMILSVDGNEAEDSGDVRRALREKKSGDTVRVEVLRGKSRQTLVATITEKEGPRLMLPPDLDHLVGPNGEWRGRVERFGGDCGDLQSRIHDLETRLKDLEKRLQK